MNIIQKNQSIDAIEIQDFIPLSLLGIIILAIRLRRYELWRNASQTTKNSMLVTERYLMNIISRLDELHLNDLTEDEIRAVEVLKNYLQKQERDLDSAHRLKVSSSRFIVFCPHCESQDVHAQTVPDEFDKEATWSIEVECNECGKKGYLNNY